MKEQIVCKNITKKFDEHVILEQVDFTVFENQSIALIGHNGCGKSTMLKILAGLLRVEKGNVEIGENLLFHYVPEHFPKMHFTARQYLELMCEMDGIAKEEMREQIQALATDFFLEDMLDTRMKALSKGTLQKVGLIQALLRKPDVLLLDEPLSGQDMDSQKVFMQKMNALRKEGVTIIMSCHEPDLIDQISDTVYEISNGRIKKHEENE